MRHWKIAYSRIAVIIVLVGFITRRIISEFDLNHIPYIKMIGGIFMLAGFILAIFGFIKIGYENNMPKLIVSSCLVIVGLIFMKIAPQIEYFNTMISGDIAIISIVAGISLLITTVGFIVLGSQIIKLEKFNNRNTKAVGVLTIIYGATLFILLLNYFLYIAIIIAYIVFFTEKKTKPLKI